MQCSAGDDKWKTPSVWQLQKVRASLVFSWFRDSKAFSRGCEMIPFISSGHCCADHINCKIAERQHQLWYVGKPGVPQSSDSSSSF